MRIVLLVLLLMSACSDDIEAPEQQIRTLINEAKIAAEGKDVGVLKGMVAEDYSDDRGYDRRAVVALVHLYLFRNRRVHLYSLIKSIEVQGDTKGTAEILVAMAGQPVEQSEQLFDIRADLMFFVVDFVRADDEWRVASATWERAGVEDFVPD